MGEGDKVYTLVLKVDLGCGGCRKKLSKYLCRIKYKANIEKIEYDEKKCEVRISGPLNCPEQLKGKLLCKFRKEIICIEIIEPKKDPPKDKLKEKFMKRCTEEYEEVKKCIEKCKEECEEKHMERLNCKCKNRGKCIHCDDTPPDPTPKPQPCLLRPQPCPTEFVICCANPCPCFVVWANHFQCCTCGVVCWPKWSGPGWSMTPGRPQWGCEPSRPPWGCEPSPTQWGCEPSRPKWGCDQSRPRPGCDPCQPNVVIESSPPCSIM